MPLGQQQVDQHRDGGALAGAGHAHDQRVVVRGHGSSHRLALGPVEAAGGRTQRAPVEAPLDGLLDGVPAVVTEVPRWGRPAIDTITAATATTKSNSTAAAAVAPRRCRLD